MFLYEDRVLIFERVHGYDYGQWGDVEFPEEEQPPEPNYPEQVKKWFEGGSLTFTRITEVDISDANAPAIVAKLYVSGDYLSARRIEGVSRIVIRSMPSGLDFKSPYEFYDELDGQGEYPQTEEEWNALWAADRGASEFRGRRRGADPRRHQYERWIKGGGWYELERGALATASRSWDWFGDDYHGYFGFRVVLLPASR